jgi:hypothetical protein
MIEDDPLLGKFIALYPSDRLRLLIPAAAITVPIALALGLTVAQIEAWWGFAITVFGMAGLGLIVGWWVMHRWNWEVMVFQRGFTVREGSKVIPLTYAEIRSIHQQAERLAYFGGMARRTLYRISITTHRDEVVVLTNVYRRVGELGERLEMFINETLRPQVQHRLHSGETVAFGATVGLKLTGIVQGERELTWDDFGGYRVEDRSLKVLQKDGAIWHAEPLAQIDNIVLLLDFLRSYIPQESGE